MDDNLWYDLRNAVYSREWELADELLRRRPGLIDARNSIGETVLHFLAVEDNQEGVAWLFSKGASLDVKNNFGIPAIFEVAQLEYKELFLWFLQHGADPYSHDQDGNDLLSHLREYEKSDMAEFVSANVPDMAATNKPESGSD